MNASTYQNPVVDETIFKRIVILRDMQVITDSDLADLYGVTTKRLNEQVKRNIERFPPDFMFQLTTSEWENLRSQNATSSKNNKKERPGGRRYLPYMFTEHGIAMLSSVLGSPQAIQVNIAIVRVFVKLRNWASNYSEMLVELRRLKDSDEKQNHQIATIYQIIEALLKPSALERKRIGFKP